MAIKPIRLVNVGTLKTLHWKNAAKHYMGRIRHWRPLQETIIKDGDSTLPTNVKKELEGQRILGALQANDYVICLDERGKSYTSVNFSKFLQDICENTAFAPCFVIGGAFGLDKKVTAVCRTTIALGAMTLPHELARVVLLEQIYRAEAIMRRSPYHH